METTCTYYLTIRLGGESITRGINGTEAAYAAYRKACELAELIDSGEDAWVDLWWGETGEVVASLRDEDEDDANLDECLEEDFFEDDLEMGFDPYEGGYTWDC